MLGNANLRQKLAAATLPLWLVACGPTLPGGPVTFPEAALMVVQSSQGLLSVAVRTAPSQPPERGVSSVRFDLTGATGERVTGATLQVVPWMPAMGHGTSVKPKVSELDGGVYQIDDVDLFMAGTWELRTAVTGAVDDHAAPSFQIH